MAAAGWPRWGAGTSPSQAQDSEPTRWVDDPGSIAPRDVVSPALAAALRVARNPLVRHTLRSAPVPEGVKQLFEIAAGRPDAVTEAIGLTGKDPHFLQAAAIYYVEEVVWTDDASPHRIVGLNPGASMHRLSEHVDVLLDWLSAANTGHDRRRELERVRHAWQEIESPVRTRRGRGVLAAFASDRV